MVFDGATAVIGLCWALGGPGVDDAPTPDAAPDAAPAPTQPPDLDAGPAAALDRLSRAQLLRADGDRTGALVEVDRALELDPELGSGYLARAQIRAEAADELEGQPDARAHRAGLLEAAARDLELYLGLAELGPTATAGLTARRDELIEQAATLRRPIPQVVEPPPPRSAVVDPGPKDRAVRRPAAVAVATVGALSTVAAAGLATASLRVERTCDALCSVRIRPRPAFFAPAVSGAGLGAALLTGAVVRLAEPGRRASRRAGIGSLVAAGALAVGATVTTTIVGVRWGSVQPRDDATLQRLQRTANASMALWMPVPALAGAGIAALRRGGRAKRRVQASAWLGPRSGGVSAQGRF